MYGVNDGRTVEIGPAEIKNETPPPPEVRIQTATVPKGIQRQTEFAATGATVSINRKVTKNGQVLLQDTTVSNYRPWQAVYLIGTGQTQ
jgi:vancomycin resistance protein YoaR